VNLDVGENSRLISGAALFGLGLGLTGLAPGPALINMFVLTHTIFYIVGMALGQVIYDHGVVPVFLEGKVDRLKDKGERLLSRGTTD